jgi:hypothetical protein
MPSVGTSGRHHRDVTAATATRGRPYGKWQSVSARSSLPMADREIVWARPFAPGSALTPRPSRELGVFSPPGLCL